jgi:hypothetical protein
MAGFWYSFLIFNKELIQILIQESWDSSVWCALYFFLFKVKFYFIEELLEHSLKDQIGEDSGKMLEVYVFKALM